MQQPIRNSAKALIIRDGLLLVNRMGTGDNVWYDLPGGGQERGETLEEAVRRECREETGVEVAVLGLRFVYDLIDRKQEKIEGHMVRFVFLCELAGDAEPRLGMIPDGGFSLMD